MLKLVPQGVGVLVLERHGLSLPKPFIASTLMWTSHVLVRNLDPLTGIDSPAYLLDLWTFIVVSRCTPLLSAIGYCAGHQVRTR